MPNTHSSRRSFALAAATAASSFRVAGAADRIRVGIVGAGDRGTSDTTVLSRRGDVEVVGVCDVYRPKAERAIQLAGIKADAVMDYRRLIERKDIDVMFLPVCDHWHVPMALEAIKAGKDVYLQKPMTFKVEEGRQMVEAVRKSGRVVQVGAQQRSGSSFLRAKSEYIDSGRIGKVTHVHTFWHGNNGYKRKVPADFRYDPATLDWGMFLGSAPKRSFDPLRYVCWYNYWDYSTGMPGGLMVHTHDVVHTLLGLSRPDSVFGDGAILVYPENRDTPDTLTITARYPQGISVSFSATLSTPFPRTDVEIHGTGGILNIFRYGYRFQPPDPKAPPETGAPTRSDAEHIDNFFDCVRSRKKPNGDVVYSHYLAMICHMGNMSLKTGQRVNWKKDWDVEQLG